MSGPILLLSGLRQIIRKEDWVENIAAAGISRGAEVLHCNEGRPAPQEAPMKSLGRGTYVEGGSAWGTKRRMQDIR